MIRTDRSSASSTHKKINTKLYNPLHNVSKTIERYYASALDPTDLISLVLRPQGYFSGLFVVMILDLCKAHRAIWNGVL